MSKIRSIRFWLL